MLKRTLGVALSQMISLAAVTPAAGAGAGASVRPAVRQANFEPEDTSFQASVQQRLQNHERRIGELEKVSHPVRTAPRAASPPSAPARTATRPSPAKPSVSSHTVRAGESPSSIARQHGISVAALMKANRLSGGSPIRPGQRLQLPPANRPAARAVPPAALAAAPTSPSPAPRSGRYGHSVPDAGTDIRYTVKPGDTVHSLAARSGISEKELCRRNGLSASSKLRAGSVLKLPALRSADPSAAIAQADRTDTAAPPPALPDGWHWHNVGRGESLSQIAARYGTDRRSIERVNNLVGGSAALREGVRLKIPPADIASADLAATPKSPPGKSSPAPADDSVLSYQVQKNDTFEDLADQFKTSPAILRRLNRLGATEPLVAGRRIVVPNTLFE